MSARPLDLNAIPKSLRNRPAVRALTLTVQRASETSYYVHGRQRIYTVALFHGKLTCSCIAAQFGTTCAHILAAERYRQSETSTTNG